MHQICVVENFIDKKCSNTIISEINNPSQINPYPEYYLNRNGGTALPYNQATLAILKKYSDKANKQIKNLFNLNFDVYTTKGYSSKWLKGFSGNPHVDNVEKEPFIEWSTVIYLNEYPEFEGGIIYFPKKNFKYVPVKYSAVFFPQQDSSYIHGITEVTSGTRYTLLFHHSSKIEFADPDFLKNEN
jgi:hypothetical protein